MFSAERQFKMNRAFWKRKFIVSFLEGNDKWRQTSRSTHFPKRTFPANEMERENQIFRLAHLHAGRRRPCTALNF